MEIKYTEGTCLSMCSTNEIKFRELNGLLHYFEIDHTVQSVVKADPERVVKIFSRSAAGRLQTSPENLRPSPILLKTLNYLVDEIIPSTKLPWVSVYDFVNDRIQAIRQDMTIQMLEDDNATIIMEKCVRFYVTASYVLCEENQTKFDQHLNTQQLTICLEKLFVLYKRFKSKNIQDFISIYISQKLLNSTILYRSVSVFSSYSSNSTVKLSIAISCAYITENFINFFRLVKKLPLIMQMSFFTHFSQIRIQALKVMSVAYSSPACKFPVDVLSSWLCLEKYPMLQLCENCNIDTKNGIVCFNKKTIKMCSPLLKREKMIDSKLTDVSLSNLINGFT